MFWSFSSENITYIKGEGTQDTTREMSKPITRNDQPEIGGWVVRWNNGKGLSEAVDHMHVFSTLSPFSFEITPDGKVSDVLLLDSPRWDSLRAAAKKEAVKIIPSFLWMDTTAMDAVLSASTTRMALADRIADTVVRTNTDGADIDFEWMSTRIRPQFLLFLFDLKTKLHGKMLTCSIEARLPDGDDAKTLLVATYNASLGKVCDEVRLMAYDIRLSDEALATSQPVPYIPTADIRSVKKAIQYLALTVPREKIVLGIPTYGYEYLVTEHSDKTTYKLLWSFGDSYLKQQVGKHNITPTHDDSGEARARVVRHGIQKTSALYAGMEPFTISSIGSSTEKTYNLLTWSSAESVRGKLELAKAEGLKGVSLFRIDGDIDPRAWEALQGE